MNILIENNLSPHALFVLVNVCVKKLITPFKSAVKHTGTITDTVSPLLPFQFRSKRIRHADVSFIQTGIAFIQTLILSVKY